jgi:hypothetical protein
MRLDRDERLHAAILNYLEALERGDPPKLDSLLTDDSDLAAELRQFVETWEYVERFTGPLRQVVSRAAPLARRLASNCPEKTAALCPPTLGYKLPLIRPWFGSGRTAGSQAESPA